MRAKLAASLLVCSLFACGETAESPAGSAAAREPEAVPARAETKPGRSERPLPNFSGFTLDGDRLEIRSLIGQRLLLFFFNPEVKDAEPAARAVESVAGFRRKHNFQVVGVAVGSSRAKTAAFVARHGIDFPVIDDSSGAVTRRLGLRSPVALFGVDAEGYFLFGYGAFDSDAPDPAALVEATLREALRLPALDDAKLSGPGDDALAPDFRAEMLRSDETFSLSEHRGRAVVLMFFLHTCPHCHDALGFLRKALADIPEDVRPLLVGLEVTGQTRAVRESLERDKLDFFPVVFDRDASIRDAYGVFGGVPDIFLIDRQGRIESRIQGWERERQGNVLRMRLAKIAGAPVPMLLSADGYTGNEACGVCHGSQHETWLFTSHASAFATLVKHGAERNEECVSCHVVGYGKPGGFTSSVETPQLEDVGCESCHGRGGPHLSPGFLENGSYESACVTCHDTKHSLGFEYATFLPRISHAANLHLTKLPPEEKRKRLAARGDPRGSLLPTRAEHVGSDACRSCHPAEYQTWAASGHARAVATLAAKGQQQSADCLRCHTTGFGKTGGFPEDAAPAAHPDLARVGCESCHGPGGEHVKEGTAKLGSIVSLGDKCDSCVILQICGACHDDANDPGFEFAVEEKIEKQRHGTIEAGTGRPLGPSARRPEDLAAEAFALLESR